MAEEIERYTAQKQDVIQEEEEMEPVECQPEAEETKESPPTADVPQKFAESQDQDYTAKLENRLRELAGRLHELESYKLLCERKILELSPSHPLPVKTSHLGRGPPTASGHVRSGSVKSKDFEQLLHAKDADMTHLQQKVDKLTAELRQLKLSAAKKSVNVTAGEASTDEEIRCRLETLENEKAGLEESLRGEMLVNEEQRNYIEILKEAMEAKIEDMGLAALLEQARGREGKTICDVFVKLTSMKKQLDEKRKEVVKSEGNVAEMESLIVDLKRQTEEQKAQLQQLNKDCSKAEQDKGTAGKLLEELNKKTEKLQKDNDALLDYAEESEEYKKNAEAQLAQLKDQCEKMEAELKEKSRKADDEHSKSQTLVQESQKLEANLKQTRQEQSKEIAELGKGVKDLQAIKTGLEARCAQYETKQRDLTSDLARKSDDVRSLAKEAAEHRDALAKLSLVRDNNEKAIRDLNGKLTEAASTIKLMKETGKAFEEKATTEQKILEQSVRTLEGKVKALEEENRRQKEEIGRIGAEWQEEERKNAECAQTINYLTNNLTETQGELEKILEAYEELNKKCKKQEEEHLAEQKKFEGETKQLKEREEDAKLEKQRLITQLENDQKHYKDEIRGKDEEIKGLRRDIVQVSEARNKERETKTQELNETHESLRKVRTENLQLKSNLGTAKEEINGLVANLEKLKGELDYKVQELGEFKERLKETLEEYERANKRLRELLDENKSLRKLLEEKESEATDLGTKLEMQKDTAKGLKNSLAAVEERSAAAEKSLAQTQSNLSSVETLKARLTEENRDLQGQLSAESSKKQELSAELERLNAEASETRKNLIKSKNECNVLQRQAKEAAGDAATLRKIVDKVAELEKELSDKYVQSVSEKLADEKAIFGSELREFAFPPVRPENVFEWLESLRSFFVLVSTELEGLGQTVAGLQAELAKQRLATREAEERQKAKMTELTVLKDREKVLKAESAGLKDRVNELAQRLADASSDLKQLENNRKVLDQAEKEAAQARDRLADDVRELSAQKEKVENDLRDWISTAENNTMLINTLEQKIRQIAGEKRDFELMLTRIYACIPSSEMQKTVSEMVKIQRELHIALRDKETNEKALQAALEELKAADPEKVAPAKESVARLEDTSEKLKKQIESFKERLEEFGVQLKEVEAKDRAAMYSKTEKEMNVAANQTMPVGKPKVSERPKTSSYKSPASQGNEDAFANTLAKVRQSLSKHSGSSNGKPKDETIQVAA